MIKHLLLMSFIIYVCATDIQSEYDEEFINKTIFVTMLARNKEHTLPYFFKYFEQLTYPKKNMILHIRSDHNEDKTDEIIESWLSENREHYKFVDIITRKKPIKYSEENNETKEWVYERNMNVIFLREESLEEAKINKADYIWFLDLDVILSNQDVLQELLKYDDLTILAPMLETPMAYSNFWGAMTDDYWYLRSDEYMDIVHYNIQGCFAVALVHSCFLVNLNDPNSNNLSFLKHNLPVCNSDKIPNIDNIIYALSAHNNDIKEYICNDVQYGQILIPYQSKEEDINQLKEIELNLEEQQPINFEDLEDIEVSAEEFIQEINFWSIEDDDDEEDERLIIQSSSEDSVPHQQHENSFIDYNTNSENIEATKIFKLNNDFDKIYCLKLSSRPEEEKRMKDIFKKYDITETFVDTFDQRHFNSSFLDSNKLSPLEKYDGKIMTHKDVKKFLSHYFLWKNIVDNSYKQVIILEDDVNILKSFNSKMSFLLSDIEYVNLDWDFIYLGRKPITPYGEAKVRGSSLLVKPSYSYGTFAYMLSLRGAQMLLDAEPLDKMVPLDEFISIMFDMHPKASWKSSFEPRNVKAFAIDPTVVEFSFSDDDDEEEEEYATVDQVSFLFQQVFDFKSDNAFTLNRNMKTEL